MPGVHCGHLKPQKASPAAGETTGEVVILADQKSRQKGQLAMDSELLQNPKLDAQKG